MNTALAKQHLDVGLVRLRIQVVYQKDRQIDLLTDNHSGNLSIASHRTGMHASNIRVHPFFLESFTNQISGRTRTNNMVVRQELSVMYRPFYHFRLTIVVRYKRDSQLFHTLYLFNY
jgi:hypothetical protein